ncbi:pentapeptide repeat-containing protein [Lyngbya sp. CCY1209]|uniref:pentapeptide repeat-containing protein n=1 Tax=Lyngbya sp. CCY1209 TaxID=2886103 RepID=UPI002D1FFC91|nr:pentapeptide repeat-containing protein [Lyngbya sp. CCY1209]MEB3885316.1 pentapeptide repeat-containing protein [Lyngbya sp. CCY1209]
MRPSRELLVIILGTGSAAGQLEAQVAHFLIGQGLDIFIPGQPECNCLPRERRTPRSDRFWCEGGITLSRIHQAKGQEADLVYLVGLDRLAASVESVTVRHQLFIALTRTRGWVRLSGIGNFPFYGELWRTIRHRDSLTFRVGSFPGRQIGLNAADELRRRYGRGHRNFRGIDLAGAQLAGHCLRDANLVAANLQGADLTAANLDDARLAAANLSRATLDRAKLRKASLAGAILSGATLAGADLSRADLRDADLRRADLTDAILRGSQIMGADLSHANLKGANLLDADLSETGLIGTHLKTAVMPDGEIHP